MATEAPARYKRVAALLTSLVRLAAGAEETGAEDENKAPRVVRRKAKGRERFMSVGGVFVVGSFRGTGA